MLVMLSLCMGMPIHCMSVQCRSLEAALQHCVRTWQLQVDVLQLCVAAGAMRSGQELSERTDEHIGVRPVGAVALLAHTWRLRPAAYTWT